MAAALLAAVACRRAAPAVEVDAGVSPRDDPNDPVVEEIVLHWQTRILESNHPMLQVGQLCSFEGTYARTRAGRRPLWIRGTCGTHRVYEPFLEDLGGGPLDHGDHGRCRLQPQGDRYALFCPPHRSPARTVWSHWLEHSPGNIATVTHQWLPAWTVRLHWEPLSAPARVSRVPKPSR